MNSYLRQTLLSHFIDKSGALCFLFPQHWRRHSAKFLSSAHFVFAAKIKSRALGFLLLFLPWNPRFWVSAKFHYHWVMRVNFCAARVQVPKTGPTKVGVLKILARFRIGQRQQHVNTKEKRVNKNIWIHCTPTSDPTGQWYTSAFSWCSCCKFWDERTFSTSEKIVT
jgi:hypothetical protein